ncbi:MAG: site-specific integrase [Chitinophagaceae bacterium]|nr:site-specific integrase [Chitinophagaceae bacterium]
MKHVTLKLLQHRDKDCIGIYFAKDAALQSIIRKHTDARWSKTHTCWYVEDTAQNRSKLKAALNKDVEFFGREVLEKTGTETGSGRVARETRVKEGRTRTAEEKKVQVGTDSSRGPAKTEKLVSKREAASEISLPSGIIHDVNVPALQKLERELVLKGYSPSTIRTYKNEFAQFLVAIKKHRAEEFTPDRLKDYLQYCAKKLNLSENTLHSRMNALKFYYEKVLGREKFFWSIPRPKKPKILPKLLGEDELKRLFNALENKKHKAMLFTAYSAGLRVSEIVNLKIRDIDSDRMQIFVARAKGKKDRYVNLSPILLDILRNYIKEYRPQPKVFLFESEQTRQPYPTRTVQQIFTNAKNKAGIKKEVGIHSLRHSFATHLLEKGTDIKYIKDLLGHFNIKTTEIYLHVRRESLVNITSPLDDLWKKGKIEW